MKSTKEDYVMGKMALKAGKSGLADKDQVLALLKCAQNVKYGKRFFKS